MLSINTYTVKLVQVNKGLYSLITDCITSPDIAVDVVNKVLDLENEVVHNFCMISLDTRKQVLGVHVIHKGSIQEVMIDPRVCFQQALLNNAASVIFFNNNPSGLAEPSPDDKESARRLKKAGLLLGIEVEDYIVVGRNSFHSIKSEKFFEEVRYEYI